MAETIGLDIGSHSIKLVGLAGTPQGPSFVHLGIKEIPYGMDKEDLASLSELVGALFKEMGLKPGKVRLTVSGSGVNVRQLTLPSIPRPELKEAVRWELRDHLPFPIESAQVGFHILQEFVEGNVKRLNLVAVACPNHLIDRTLSIAKGAGLKPEHLEAGPFALWNALATWDHLNQGEVVALIELGNQKTGIHLFRDGALQFSREVTPAGMDVTRAIMEGFESEEQPELLYERAQRLKEELGISLKDSPEKIDGLSIPLSKLSFLVRPVIERLITEIGRSLDYFKIQSGVDRIDRMLLTGGSAYLRHLVPLLKENLGHPVQEFNSLSVLFSDTKGIAPSLLDQKGLVFTTAAGLALPGSDRIELLPRPESFWSGARMERTLPIFSSVILLVIFLGIVWFMNGKVAALEKEWKARVEKVTALDTLQARLQVLKQKENEMKQDLSLFPSSLREPIPFQEVLRSVSKILPENVTVSLLAIKNKEGSSKADLPSDGARELQISGLAFGSDQQCLMAVARIIDGLEKSPFFDNVRLVSADEQKSSRLPGAKFEMVCDITANPSLSSTKAGGEE